MKVSLERDEIEKAIKQYIESNYLSDSLKFRIQDIDLIEEILVEVEVKKLERVQVEPYQFLNN